MTNHPLVNLGSSTVLRFSDGFSPQVPFPAAKHGNCGSGGGGGGTGVVPIPETHPELVTLGGEGGGGPGGGFGMKGSF